MGNTRIDIPARRAPRLPRDHFAMHPQISRGQRVARAISLFALFAYVVAQIYTHYHGVH